MGINMQAYKVIYKERAYNCLDMMPDCPDKDGKSKFLTIAIINEDGEYDVIKDETFMFQFLPRK